MDSAIAGGTLRDSTAALLGAAAKPAAHGVDWGAVIAQVALWAGIVGAVAGVIAIVPMFRNGVRGIWRAVLMRAGVSYHRYARKFIDRYGTYDNPYLRVREKRDLRTTFVPLSFQTDETQSVAIATDVLRDLPAGRLIIVGDPGSGKSTLLRAYAVAALEGPYLLRRRTRVVPYLVPLRDLAAYLDEERGIADFITDKILNGYGVFKRDQAAEFFLRTLEREQAVVMLDGLDEVPDDRQQSVLAAVISFMSDTRPECPTGLAKLLLTCRTQNFEMLRDDWLSAFSTQNALYALAPLRDSEIISYLLKFKALFKAVDGPARFMRSVRESGTLDLLRAPLILAIALGLYADRPTLIPSTVFELYHQMIEELLDRHAFRHEHRPDQSLLRFRRSDKYRFLREFALHAAQVSGNFADFPDADMHAFAVNLAPRLDAVGDGKAMVSEILNHSGLLSEAGHDRLWHFAHRSVQEFLAAEELRLRGDGDGILLDRASDLNWRQAVQFYTAGQEARQVDDFLRQLAKRNSELAAHCLRAARPSDETARTVLDALEPVTNGKLPALATATRSPRVSVRAMAVERLSEAIRSGHILAASSAGEGLLPLLDTISDTGAAEIAALVPHVISNVPDDPRLAGPLWRCLNADGIEHSPVCGEIVRRLLTMVMEPNAFAELERQDPHDREFLTKLRSQAYPFTSPRALSPDHNLVTLLAWAHYLGVSPEPANRFFQAKAAERLARVESDRQRTIAFSLGWPTRIVTGLLALAVIGVTITVLAARPGLLLHPFGWWTLALIGGVAATPVGLMIGWAFASENNDSVPWLIKIPEGEDEDAVGNLLVYLWVLEDQDLPISGLFGILVFPFCFAIAPIALARDDLTAYLIVALAAQTFNWLTTMNLFGLRKRYYLYQPNEFVDMYNDPKSRHWLVPARSGTGDG
jgi:hypothetical protein